MFDFFKKIFGGGEDHTETKTQTHEEETMEMAATPDAKSSEHKPHCQEHHHDEKCQMHDEEHEHDEFDMSHEEEHSDDKLDDGYDDSEDDDDDENRLR